MSVDTEIGHASTIPPPRTLPIGVHVQPYIDAIQGATHAARMDAWKRGCDEMHDAGVAAVFPHLFPHRLDSFDELTGAALASGLSFGGALGLDASSISPEDKGDALADVATRPGSLGVLADSEGHYDPQRRDEMRRMGKQARKAARDAFIAAQPWPQCLSHPGFPYEEEDAFCDVDCPQFYVNDWMRLGHARCSILIPKWNGQWARLESTRLAAFNRPMFPTWQGRGWDDIPADCGDAIITRPRVILWCEPWPSALVVRQIRARQFLAARGFIAPDWSNAATAVQRFQRAHNVNASVPIATDGRCGVETLTAMGIAA